MVRQAPSSPPSGTSTQPRHAVKEHLLQDICKPALRIHLLVISFGTGLLDAGSYADFGIFASNQTGNTIILLTEAVASTRSSVGSGAPILTVGVSLAAFLAMGAIFGQLGNHLGRCRRIWLAFSTLVQATFLLVTAILLQTRVFRIGEMLEQGEYSRADVDGALIIFMLAAASGIQVSMAKSVGVPECPSAMLTSPYSDLVTDPHLFAPHLRTHQVFSRNIRLIYILTLSAGTLVGAALYYYADTVAVVWVAFALRTGNLVHILLAGAVLGEEEGGEEQRGDGKREGGVKKKELMEEKEGEGATPRMIGAKEQD
ncbi:hypothetical protein BCV69DRAFT_312628 [Microstroma glucosiphilum]|uniref:DUF1275 domain protein n=1 Tax=Pseudomicrostroma glucosiphilum TaxID=1684307 RepID=A0A316U607_9BASI|nr:hypothetical protein BCV69DRAFT_312628 [Pseudomicrostroma glucosiphilum]PWN20676.1 hypothetical protein BCV69DRAFT_312628 [Pseudomicrostroma glucosiphilum]